MGRILTIRRFILTTCFITFSVAANCADASEIKSEVIPLKHAKAEEIAALLNQSTPAVAVQIIADIRSNSLLVFGSKEQIEMVKRKALTADVLSPPILIEAAVLEVELPLSQKVGVQHADDRSLATTDRFLGSSISWSTNLVRVVTTNRVADEPRAFTYVAGLDNGFNSTVAALAEGHRVKVIQKPRIQTSSGTQASLFVGPTIPYGGGSQYDGNSGSPHYSASIGIGQGLEIIPKVMPEGMIIADIRTTFDSVPNVTTTTSSAIVTVRNGNMLLIGGAIHNGKQRSPPTSGRGAMLDRSNRPRRTEQVILLRFAVLSPDGDFLGAK